MEWEIYKEVVRGISAEISGGKMKVVHSINDVSYAVRVIVDGKLGFSAGRSVEKAMENAKKLAKISEEKLDSFPVEKPANVLGIYDKDLEELNPEILKEEYEILVNSVNKAKIASAMINHSVIEIYLTNSSGAELSEKTTFSSFYIETVYGEGSGFSQCESRKKELEIAQTACYAEELAIKSSKAVRIESGYYDVILTPYAVHQLFSNILYPSLSAENALKGRSLLKKGSYVGELKLIDDPTIEGGIESYSFDDEGVKARRKVLVDKEVLCFYSDWKNSPKFGITGNGLRASIDLPPSPAPSNIIVEIDKKAESDRALLIHNFIGSHTANPLSGDFSLECMNAEIDGDAVRGVMIYGNLFEILKKIQGYCSELKQVENTITPAIRFEKIKIV
ncbi:MAG: TldD/PmbA family protein [Archaeoglobaceae archaeon]|nr:TldD/PmbA family protein [Archaeoglobaceae archaeon]